jgi:hypothetical protein
VHAAAEAHLWVFLLLLVVVVVVVLLLHIFNHELLSAID